MHECGSVVGGAVTGRAAGASRRLRSFAKGPKLTRGADILWKDTGGRARLVSSVADGTGDRRRAVSGLRLSTTMRLHPIDALSLASSGCRRRRRTTGAWLIDSRTAEVELTDDMITAAM